MTEPGPEPDEPHVEELSKQASLLSVSTNEQSSQSSAGYECQNFLRDQINESLKVISIEPIDKMSLKTEKYRNTKLNEIKSFFQDAFLKLSNNKTQEAVLEGKFNSAFKMFFNPLTP